MLQPAPMSKVYAVSRDGYKSIRETTWMGLYPMPVTIWQIFFIAAVVANQARHFPCRIAESRDKDDD